MQSVGIFSVCVIQHRHFNIFTPVHYFDHTQCWISQPLLSREPINMPKSSRKISRRKSLVLRRKHERAYQILIQLLMVSNHLLRTSSLDLIRANDLHSKTLLVKHIYLAIRRFKDTYPGTQVPRSCVRQFQLSLLNLHDAVKIILDTHENM